MWQHLGEIVTNLLGPLKTVLCVFMLNGLSATVCEFLGFCGFSRFRPEVFLVISKRGRRK
jgi:hypothetical protein